MNSSEQINGLRAALKEREAKLAALEKQEPYLDAGEWQSLNERCCGIHPALYAAAGAAPFDPDASYQEHLDSTVGIDPAGAPAPEGWQLVPIEPTDAMLVSARDWSYAKYGKPIGNAAAVGCWEAMLATSPKEPT